MSFINLSQIFACKQFAILKKDFNRFMKLILIQILISSIDLTGYGNSNIKSLGNYYLTHGYLSKEEKEKIVDEWTEFRSKINFIAKKKNTLIEVFQCILLENLTELKNILLSLQIMMDVSVNSHTLSDVMCIGISSTFLEEFSPETVLARCL